VLFVVVMMLSVISIQSCLQWHVFAICSIYAIGDCIEGPMLAHKAEDEGISVTTVVISTYFSIKHCEFDTVYDQWPRCMMGSFLRQWCCYIKCISWFHHLLAEN